jgi:hypothetical protein
MEKKKVLKFEIMQFGAICVHSFAGKRRDRISGGEKAAFKSIDKSRLLIN